MALKREADIGMLLQERHVCLNCRLLVGANIRLVVVEIDVLHILREQLLVTRCWLLRRRRWRRRIHGYAGGGCLRSAFTFGRQGVGGRVRRTYLLRPVRLHGAYSAVNADVGGVGGLPSQGG